MWFSNVPEVTAVVKVEVDVVVCTSIFSVNVGTVILGLVFLSAVIDVETALADIEDGVTVPVVAFGVAAVDL